MADDTAAEEMPVSFNIKSSSEAKYSVSIPLTTTVGELKEKLSTKEYADLPPERQRLIYSGRVMKDSESLASYKIKEGMTVHLVKGAASNERQNPASQGSAAGGAARAGGAGGSAVQPAVPTMSTGTGNNPLAGLTGARYAGFAQLPNQSMFGPDGGMGPPPDPEDMIRMLQNPQFASVLNEALSNPQVLDAMISQNPMLRDMGPQVRQMMQSSDFRRMMTDPQQLRNMMQMQRMFGGGGRMGMGGGSGGASAFPAPGATDTSPDAQNQPGQIGEQQQGQQQPLNPLAGAFGGAGQQGAGAAAGNPFAALLNNPAVFGNMFENLYGQPQAAGTQAQDSGENRAQSPQGQQQQQQPPASGDASQNPQAASNGANNPFAATFQDPQVMANILAGFGPGANQNPPNPQDPNVQQARQNLFTSLLGANPNLFNPFGAGIGGAGGPPQQQSPPDTRPPEERFANELRQLNDMGFYDFDRNIEALRRTGGSVQGAVDYLLTH